MHDDSSNAVNRAVPSEGLEEWFAGSRRTLSVLAILVLTATLVVGISSAEADDPTEFTFSGTVTAADSGAALSGMKVSIFCTDCEGTYTDPQKDPARPWLTRRWSDGTNLLAEATTDSSGNWSLTVAEPSEGAWSGYINASTVVWDPDGDYGMQTAGPAVSVGDEVVSMGTTTKLEEGGKLSGTISGDGATPPEVVYLSAVAKADYSNYGNLLVHRRLGIIVGADGSYTTPGLPNDTYYITYPSDLSGRYVSGATPALGSIIDGEDTAADHELFEYATFTGRVTDGSGNGLSGIRVYASPTGGSAESFYASPFGGSSKRFETLTDHDGNYSYDSAVPGSSFTVEFTSLSGKYASEYYDDKTNLDEADVVEIPRRGDVPNIDAQLGPGSTVSGSVIEITEEDPTGAPRWSAAVYLCSNDHCQRTRSNSAGFFKLSGLSPATYSLRVSIWRSEAETTVELSEGTERYFVAVLDGDNSEITEHQDDASDTFEDIADGAHHEQAVAWMIRHGITTGCNREPALFCPDSDLTRAQFVTFLWRASGKPEPSIAGSEVFGDVAAGHFADQAIGWAKEADVTTGCAQATETTEARFCIDSPVKRGQIATFLHRFVEEPESTLDHGFTDIDQGRYFSEPVAWTAEHMFVDGCSSTSFCPDDDADRATAAVFIHGVATNPDSWANRTSDFQYG